MNGKRTHWLPVVFMVLAFALTRLPGSMPPNFSAAYALAFCAGVYFSGGMAWWLPLGVMLGTDLFLNVFYYETAWLSPRMALNYASLAALIGLGRCFRGRFSWWTLLGGGLLGAILFYLITNTGSWLVNPAYPKTLAGWIQALTSGIPGYPPTWTFFRNTLMSGGLFTGLFVGAMKLSESREPEEETEPVEEGEPVEAEEG